MNKKIFIVLAFASLFVSTQAASTLVKCYKPDGTTEDTGCQTCPNSGPGTCTTCLPGYYAVVASGMTTCTACATGCKTCTGTTAALCTAAADNYVLSGGVLTQCATNCKTCTANTVAACTAAMPGYQLDASPPTTISPCGGTGCSTCPAGTGAAQCATSLAGYFVSGGPPGTATGCQSTTLCSVCSSATVCTTPATGAYLVGTVATACTDASAATCSASASLTCQKGTLDTNNLCCGVQGCATCTASTNAACTTCSAGYFLSSSTSCVACVTNCATCASATTCQTCATNYVGSGGSTNAYTSCVASTPVPSTSSPGSAFNVTPALVYTTTDTTAPAFTAVSGTPIFGPGADSTSAYVWLLVNPASTPSTSTYSVNKRTVNTSGTFAKSNTTADVAISTSITAGTIVNGQYGVAPGWFWIVSSNCYASSTSCYWNSIGGTAVTQEITLNYVAGTGSSMTSKALTGNTNANVFFDVQSTWYNNGTIFVAYVMSTRAVASSTVADSWTANGLYIQGVNVTSGALYYSNNTGGVKALALTQSSSGATTCVATTSSVTGSGCASNYWTATAGGVGNAVTSFTVWPMNWTTTDTVQYGWVDSTASAAPVYKTGTINCTTGVATSGTTLATYSTATASGTTTTTYYSFLGGLASQGTYGVFLSKRVRTQVTSPSSDTSVYTIQGFLNGSATANTNFTVASGYLPASISGFHTSDGFLLMETQTSTTSPAPAQPTLLQAERFFTNGSTYSTAVNLGTYGASVQSYQDTNGSVIVGYTIKDTLQSKTYSGYMGTYIAQNLAGVSLTTIFGLLCFMIVALFAF